MAVAMRVVEHGWQVGHVASPAPPPSLPLLASFRQLRAVAAKIATNGVIA
jgi:hypothetical protein